MKTRDPKISIYLIAGHEAQFIGRALSAFQPLCSELVVCIAQGGRPDDGTRAIVEKSGRQDGRVSQRPRRGELAAY
jgi:hypothetical protein